MADNGRVPKVVMDPSAMRSMRLDAVDGFVLSRVDGVATERELADLTGLPDPLVRASLEKLASFGVIELAGSPKGAATAGGGGGPAAASPGPGRISRSIPAVASAPAAEPRPGTDAGQPNPARPGTGPSGAAVEAAIAAVPDDAPELVEACDLPVDLRRRIVGMYSASSSLDYYALLSVPREAEKKAVKQSYFALAGFFHPDRYFRKNLGSIKPKMEAVFARISEAYEILSNKERRAEYDQYLLDVEKARSVEGMLRDVMAEVRVAEQTAIEQARRSESACVPPPVDSQPAVPPHGAPRRDSSVTYAAVMPRSRTTPEPAPGVPPAPSSASSLSEQRRREALAMRLMRGGRPTTKAPGEASFRPVTKVPAEPAGSPVGRPPTDPGSRPVTRAPAEDVRGQAGSPSRTVANDANDPLRRRYEERVEAGRRHQGEKYVSLAQGAEARGDTTSAAASYRVALSFLREDDPTRAHALEVISKSEASLGENYTRQAQHEERATRWEDAVKSWERAAKLRSQDPMVLDRYANALVQTAGDFHEAAQFAQKAVALAPKNGDYRCTLVSVYVAAGLNLNARREVEAAAQQFPNHAAIQALLKKVPRQA